MRTGHILLALVALFGIAVACAPLKPVDTGSSFIFALESAPAAASHKEPRAQSLTVALPTAAPELDTYRIALMMGGKWDYYAGARFADFLPLIAQDNLTRSIAGAGLFQSVTSDQTGARSDLVMHTDIRDFHAVYGHGLPLVRVTLDITVKPRTGSSTPATRFTAKGEARADKDALASLQGAFATAFRIAQQDVIRQIKLLPEPSVP